MKTKDLSGKKFNSLYVIGTAPKKGGKIMWRCRCDCGSVLNIRGSHLVDGQKSCKSCTRHDHNIKHGLHGHPSYRIWVMMKQRCENPNATGYHNYGAIGVRVCGRWQNFELFAKDVGCPPSKGHSLDRYPNKLGNYEPGNWRWATSKEQARNTRFNRIIKYNGKSKSVTEWAEIMGMSASVLFNRLESGWSVDDSFNRAVRVNERVFGFNGKSLTIKEWAKYLGMKKSTINNRVYAGWPLDKVFVNKKYKSGKNVQNSNGRK